MLSPSPDKELRSIDLKPHIHSKGRELFLQLLSMLTDRLNTMKIKSIKEIKLFLNFFLPIINNNHRHALRYVFRHSIFAEIPTGNKISVSSFLGYSDSFILVLQGFVSGYILEFPMPRRDVWLGVSGSVYFNESLVNEVKGFNLEALEDSWLLIIPRKELEKGCDDYPILNRLFSHLLFPNAIRDLNNITLLSKLDGPENKLRYFKTIYPKVWKQVPERIYRTYLIQPDL